MNSSTVIDATHSPILIKKLDISDKLVFGMIHKIENRAKSYFESDNNFCYVGDSDSFDQLHLHKEFNCLNSEVEKMLKEFIEVYLIDDSQCNFYIQKSWPVFLKNDTEINSHTHPNSHISFVYYLQVDDDNETGKINFQRLQDHWNNTVPFKSSFTAIEPKNNIAIMFPSSLLHWVDDYFGDLMRISITYDITITTKLVEGATKSEMMISDPSIWRKLNG